VNKLPNFIKIISERFPGLEVKLLQSGIQDTKEEFVKKTLITALYMTFGITLFLWLVLTKLGPFTSIIFMLAPILFSVFFFYLLKIPDFKIIKIEREINSEILYAGRFLIIELQSGVTLYDSFKNIAKNFETMGKYFSDIVNKIDLGTPIEEALNEAVEFTPSSRFRKILWQIINSQHTGADMAQALKSVVNQITKEQLIEIQEYGKKLNPLAMFYMILAVILPSIGITMFIILSTFLELNLELPLLLFISFFLGFVQFMFLAIIRSSRPSVEL
jgi:archaeal flagellar protein FlaJ